MEQRRKEGGRRAGRGREAKGEGGGMGMGKGMGMGREGKSYLFVKEKGA